MLVALMSRIFSGFTLLRGLMNTSYRRSNDTGSFWEGSSGSCTSQQQRQSEHIGHEISEQPAQQGQRSRALPVCQPPSEPPVAAPRPFSSARRQLHTGSEHGVWL